MKQCLYGTYSENVAGYCKYHRCSMTVRQIKCKKCLGKQCHYLQKNEDHQYWHQREVMKQKRKNKKETSENYLYSITNHH